MKKGIYKFSLDCGRMGTLVGVFIATNQQVEELVSHRMEVYFGEVLGKHSEVYSMIEKKHLKLLTNDQQAIDVVKKYGLNYGINPFNYRSLNFSTKSIGLDSDATVGEIINRLLELKNDNGKN